jgi:hypothetical protein
MGMRRCHRSAWFAWTGGVRQSLKERARARILFDRFPIVKHLNEAVDEVRRSEMRRLSLRRESCSAQPLVAAESPWNLNPDQKNACPLVRWNAPIVRAYYLKVFQLFWDCCQVCNTTPEADVESRAAMKPRSGFAVSFYLE